MPRRTIMIALAVAAVSAPAVGDETLYRYEGDVLPYDESAGWALADPCEDECHELLEDGHFVLLWPDGSDDANYSYLIAATPDQPPPTLWVEWRYRSNHPIGPIFWGCDGRFSIIYGGMHDVVYLYGDGAISREGGDAITGLDMEEFHTYRYESLDGINYWISADGQIFMLDAANQPSGVHNLQFGGSGGCNGDQVPNKKEEWDFVRYGTISFGEQIVSSDPPAGNLDPAVYGDLDRFTVTFDSANYVYIDDITVEVTGGVAPAVIQTRRRENDDVDTVEIALDGPMPLGETTRFTFNDGEATNIVEYSLVPPPVPAISSWGVVIMALLFLTAGTLLFIRRAQPMGR